MDITAVICEYNPFHNGHKIQIEYIKSNYPDTVIVAIMSGNIVQRGELACAEKYDRARIALDSGVDAVLEMPYPYCGASAGYFAFAGVSIAKKIAATRICFGSECGSIELLSAVADRLSEEKFENQLKKELIDNRDTAYMTVRSRLYYRLYGEQIPSGANNLLGIEYIIGAKKIGYTGEFITCKREDNFSATECRRVINSGDKEELLRLVPGNIDVYFSPKTAIDPIFLWRIGNADATELTGYADIDPTLGAQMVSSAEKSSTLAEYYSLCTGKKYPLSRVARASFNVILKTTEKQLKSDVLFCNLLGCNGRGRKFLSQNRKNERIAIITKNADYKKYGVEVEAQYEFSQKADRLFSLSRGLERDYVMKKSPCVIK